MNEVREAAEFGWSVVSAILGAVFTLVIYAFTAGKKTAEWVTKKDLDETLKDFARKDQLEDIKLDISDIKQAQYRADAKQDKHHAQVIEALLRGRE